MHLLTGLWEDGAFQLTSEHWRGQVLGRRNSSCKGSAAPQLGIWTKARASRQALYFLSSGTVSHSCLKLPLRKGELCLGREPCPGWDTLASAPSFPSNTKCCSPTPPQQVQPLPLLLLEENTPLPQEAQLNFSGVVWLLQKGPLTKSSFCRNPSSPAAREPETHTPARSGAQGKRAEVPHRCFPDLAFRVSVLSAAVPPAQETCTSCEQCLSVPGEGSDFAFFF